MADRPPDTSIPTPSPPRFPLRWMKAGETPLLSQLGKSPCRSPLLLQASKSASTPNLTKGQMSRMHIADIVRLPHL